MKTTKILALFAIMLLLGTTLSAAICTHNTPAADVSGTAVQKDSDTVVIRVPHRDSIPVGDARKSAIQGTAEAGV